MSHELQPVADALTKVLAHIYGKPVGFALVVGEFTDKPGGYGGYISNVDRNDMIKILRECAETLEARAAIPGTIGEA